MKSPLLLPVITALAGLLNWSPSVAAPVPPATTESPAAAGARAIAREAFIYGFPFVEGYKTLYKQAVDTANRDFKAPFNQIGHSRTVATPEDKAFITPNSDTPYSYAWLDLRAEPVVITMPGVEKQRYYSAQLIDLQTHNFAYLGTRSFGNEGGDFLITGPGWTGGKPAGVKAVIPCETSIFYALFRTQLFNAADTGRVHQIQDGYQVRPLSRYLGTPAPAAAPAIAWPAPEEGMTETPRLFSFLNFLLQFCPLHESERAAADRFARLGIGAGKPFDVEKLAPEIKQAAAEGIASVWIHDFPPLMKRINSGEVTSGDLFGTREFLRNNFLYRFAGARLGIYGNSRDEALYPPFFADAAGKPLNASQNDYTLRFPGGQLPPAGAFWSLTMYDGTSQLLVANPLQRYLLNSTMLDSFQYDADGALTIRISRKSPGGAAEANWLPAPDGPFYCILRIYIPRPPVFNGQWKAPGLVPVPGGPGSGELPTTGTIDSRLGRMEVVNGYPARTTLKKLVDDLDFQRACQAYLWALPLMAMEQWQSEHRTKFGAGNLDYVDYLTFQDKLGLLTANATTPYIMAFPCMRETGPLVIEIPAGAVAGGVVDFWQRPLTDCGQTGPDKGAGGKYLILGPDDPDIKPDGYYVFRSPTVNIWSAHRALDPDPAKARAVINGLKMYPYSQRENPPPTRHVSPEGRKWSGWQPRGLAYWKGLSRILHEEPVHERDRMILGMLQPLGLGKDIPFNPDERQTELLLDAARTGELMARSIAYEKRFSGVKVWPSGHWETALFLRETSQEMPHYTQFDERSSWFYEAVGVSAGMMGRTVGSGQVYLEGSRDSAGQWLDGGKSYRLTVPRDVPVTQFWSVTAYDNETRCFVDTGVPPDRSSRDRIVKNADGSVDLYFGPAAPAGAPESNWIKTLPGRGWFAYFRLYGPAQPYFDRSWVLPDIGLIQ